MIEVMPGKLAGVYALRSMMRRDARGAFVKTMHRGMFSERGIPTDFAEQYYSVSESNVLRGLHFQIPPHDHYKLVTCIAGEVLDVVVDIRRSSTTYGRHQMFELTGEKADGVFVPSGCAHGFYVRSGPAILLYNVSAVYAPAHDAGILWNSAGIDWPSPSPAISERDAALPPLEAFNTPF